MYKAGKKVWRETSLFDNLVLYLDQDIWEGQSGRYDRQLEESAQQVVRLLSFSCTSTDVSVLVQVFEETCKIQQVQISVLTGT